MTTKGREERIRAAARAAAERLARAEAAKATDRPSMPGDLFVFGGGSDLGLEWLLVRLHPDDSSLALIAPADDFPLAGTPDVVLDAQTAGRLLTVRCGEADWVPLRFCAPRLRVGTVPDAALKAVRGRLADLARGRPVASQDPSVDFDPEYEEWVEEVARVRQSIVARAERLNEGPAEVIPLTRFTREPPPQLVPDYEYSLAAESGESLLAELGDELAGDGDVAYFEVSDVPGGRLVLSADEHGVRPVWDGPGDAAPRLVGKSASGEDVVADWVSGPQGRLHRSAVVLPWVDGRVVLQVGIDPARTVVVEL